MVAGKKQHQDFQIASMILGILSVLFGIFGIVPLLMSIAAIVFALISIKDKSHGMAVAGLVTGIFGFFESLFWSVAWTLLIISV